MNSNPQKAQTVQWTNTASPCVAQPHADPEIYLIDDQGREVLISENMIDLALRRAESVCLGHARL